MKNRKIAYSLLALATLSLCGMAQTSAQNIDARLSTREAYVGMPVILQISIKNAADFQEPKIPKIDECDVRSVGAPSRSSQITIINGRRSESQSVTMQYQITPRQSGTFEIPPITINVDGRDQQTRPLRFVATKSETGDLLFVEIEGKQDKVFVGQPLELTLKIWVKPYVDRERKIKLSEANMWQLISQQSSWGGFADRLKELAENNQRPGGQEVLRKDEDGNERAYYLYEITATVYPKRPGKIDAEDVQIVVNYPTALGKSRDPFDSLFKGSPFGGRSPLSQMMDDDFFASPFGNRLSVSSVRPIVGEAKVDATEVVPVPTEGRPADYRGAVGRYRIVTQATPTSVSAGDPITLNIGIAGTGPMELIQAPPLSELTSLTSDFKVADQSLAGFVQDETKLFTTTIRPRREGITTIPPISFSFFDPETETFETVVSAPISIDVSKSESLALDSIVSNAGRQSGGDADSNAEPKPGGPNFANEHSANVLVSQSPPSVAPWWWGFVIAPPLLWTIAFLLRRRGALARLLPRLKTAKAQCLNEIANASSLPQIEAALVRYISSRTGTRLDTRNEAIGQLRLSGMYPLASHLETFLHSVEHDAFSGTTERSLDDFQKTACELTERIDDALGSKKKSHVRSPIRGSRGTSPSDRHQSKSAVRNAVTNASLLLIAAAIGLTQTADAFASGTTLEKNSDRNRENTTLQAVQLTETQRQTLLTEAGEIYDQAMTMKDLDSAESNDLFSTAADKYQLLADSGIRNSRLYLNLGNAYLQSNRLGLAIANYQRAIVLDPSSRQIRMNLEFANSLVKGDSTAVPAGADANSDSTVFASLPSQLQRANQSVTDLIGVQTVYWILACSSLACCLLLVWSACGSRLPLKRLAIVPLLVLALSATSLRLVDRAVNQHADGFIIANSVKVLSGDGEQFDVVASLESAQGHGVEILDERTGWFRIRTRDGQSGWIKAKLVEDVRMDI